MKEVPQKFCKPEKLVVGPFSVHFTALKAHILLSEHQEVVRSQIDRFCSNHSLSWISEVFGRQIFSKTLDIDVTKRYRML